MARRCGGGPRRVGEGRAHIVGNDVAAGVAQVDEGVVIGPPHRARIEGADRGVVAKPPAARPVAAAGQDYAVDPGPEKTAAADIAEPLVAQGRGADADDPPAHLELDDRKSTRLNSS